MTKDELRATMNEARSVTENGAVGYRTTGRELLDLNFDVASLRYYDEEEIAKRFARAYYENPRLALKWLFFCRDCRGGMGERRLFRTAFAWLAGSHVAETTALIPLVVEYGRWDDLLPLLETPVKKAVVAYIRAKLDQDLETLAQGRSVSLLAKWLPSCNTSCAKTRYQARILSAALGLSERQYRKTLSKLRAAAKVVETRMAGDRWDEIDYETVPSQAAILHSKAFKRHDPSGYRDYQAELAKGTAKIHASVSFPHDIVHAYTGGPMPRMVFDPVTGERLGETEGLRTKAPDPTLEAAWKALPNFVPEKNSGTLCVVDGSGSMCRRAGRTKTTALEIANALGLYFAERLSGPFRNMYITFSARPRLVDLSRAASLRERLEMAYAHCDCSNTDLERTFDLILETAVRHDLKQEELPRNVLVLSDMEFDRCSCRCDPDGTLLAAIAAKYERAGYRLPRLVFWNLNSRTETVPLWENEEGVALVSGFSPAIAQMVLSEELDPYKVLTDQLASPRYDAVDTALANCAA